MTSQPIFTAGAQPSAPRAQQPRRLGGPRVAAESSPPVCRLESPTGLRAVAVNRVTRSHSPSVLPAMVAPARPSSVAMLPGRGCIDPGRSVERSVLEPLAGSSGRGPGSGHFRPAAQAGDLSRSPPPPSLRGPERGSRTPCRSPPRNAPGYPSQPPASGSMELPQRAAGLTRSVRLCVSSPSVSPKQDAAPLGSSASLPPGVPPPRQDAAPLGSSASLPPGVPPLSEARVRGMVHSILEPERERWNRELQNALAELRRVSERCAATEAMEERIANLESTHGAEPTPTHRSFVRADSPQRTHLLDELRADMDRLQTELLSLVRRDQPLSARGDRPDLREAVATNRNSIQALLTKQQEIMETIGAHQEQIENFAARIACVVKEAVCADDKICAKFEEVFDSRYTLFSERLKEMEANNPFAEGAALRLLRDDSINTNGHHLAYARGTAGEAIAPEQLSNSKLSDPLSTSWRGYCAKDRDCEGREPEEAGSEFQEEQPSADAILSALQNDPAAVAALSVDLRNARATVAAQEELCRSVTDDLRRERQKLLDIKNLSLRALTDTLSVGQLPHQGREADREQMPLQELLSAGEEADREQFSRERREVLFAIEAIREELRACRANSFMSAVVAAAATAKSSSAPESTLLHGPSQEMEPVVEGSDEDGRSDDESPGWRSGLR